MDPISALSVASGIITFVDFAAGLISTTQVIFNSTNGTSSENLNLENVYTQLQSFSTRLQVAADSLPPLVDHIYEDFRALQQLAGLCEKECQALIDAIRTLKVRKQDHRLWGSVRVAFKSRLGRAEIFALEGRLERMQRVMSLHVSSIISHQISTLSKTVESLRNSNQKTGQIPIIESMSKDLANLKIESEPLDSTESHHVLTMAQVQGVIDRLSSFIRSKESLQVEAILASLNYDFRPARHSAIPEAHRNTFQWAFTSHLSDWLRTGSGIFWVSGKAGSGKSTFMKFLADHSRTRELLAEWTDLKEVGIGAHYFWSAGTAMQRSQQGLLQSLLFDIFRNNPEIVRVVCPARWTNAGTDAVVISPPWTLAQLSDCLRIFASMQTLVKKACFFIDGLDEYDGDLIELCSVLRDLSASPFVKVCASSRPWVQFEDSFGADKTRSLYIHDMTQSDIQNFTRDQLVSHPRWTFEYLELDENDKRQLIEEVSERAEGVFLWAFLVARSLREGLSHDDTIADMRKRLESLPRDLETLFKHMLDGVDAVYHYKMAGALQVAIHAFEPLSIDIYWHFEKELEEPDYAILCPIGIVPPSQLTKQREQARRRINARTKGLLETRDNIVEFLHRTVRDFLLTKDMVDYLNLKLSNDFNALYSIAKAHLAVFKSTSFEHPNVHPIIRQGPGQNGGLFIAWLNQALLYSVEAVTTSPRGYDDGMRLLDEYEAFIVKAIKVSQLNIGGVFQICDPRVVFREEVVKHQLATYVEHKIRQDPEYFNVFEDSPLFAALSRMTIRSGLSLCPSFDMLQMLLKRGENPNITSTRINDQDNFTPWIYVSRTCFVSFSDLSARWENSDFFRRAVETGLISLLLSFGADPDAVVDLIDEKTAFTSYFCAALTRLDTVNINLVIQTLDAFFDKRPNLGVICSDNFNNDRSVASKEPQLTHICEWFRGNNPVFLRLEHITKFAVILESLIRYLIRNGENIQPLISAIDQKFPSESRAGRRHLLGLIKQDTTGCGATCKGKDTSQNILKRNSSNKEIARSNPPKKRRG